MRKAHIVCKLTYSSVEHLVITSCSETYDFGRIRIFSQSNVIDLEFQNKKKDSGAYFQRGNQCDSSGIVRSIFHPIVLKVF